jgi:hypothetical protein
MLSELREKKEEARYIVLRSLPHTYYYIGFGKYYNDHNTLKP